MTSILIVDDAMFMRSMLRTIVTEAGFQVCAEAGTGMEAIRQYAVHRPDVVTMDITMPDMEGIKAVKEILRLDPSARVIMCSAVGEQRTILSAIHAGAKDFVVKPFQKERVLQAITNQIHA